MKSIERTPQFAKLRPVHPFPARMAPEIALSGLQSHRKLKVLDPMSGSGTSIVLAKLLGHDAIGYDQDPLAILIAKTWCSVADESKFRYALASTVDFARPTGRHSNPTLQTRIQRRDISSGTGLTWRQGKSWPLLSKRSAGKKIGSYAINSGARSPGSL